MKKFSILPSFDRNARIPRNGLECQVSAAAVLYPRACKFGGDGTLLVPLSLLTGEAWWCTELSLPTRPPGEKRHINYSTRCMLLSADYEIGEGVNKTPALMIAKAGAVRFQAPVYYFFCCLPGFFSIRGMNDASEHRCDVAGSTCCNQSSCTRYSSSVFPPRRARVGQFNQKGRTRATEDWSGMLPTTGCR